MTSLGSGGGMTPYSPGVGHGGLTPMAPFSPEDYDSALVHIARAEALQNITYARTQPDGYIVAWESVVSLAEALTPMAGKEFLDRYRTLMKQAARTKRLPMRALWRICGLEMKRQGRLGGDAIPLDVEKFGVEAK